MVIYSRGGKYMKNNIIKLIIGIFATGTVVTTSAVITTKVVENKENKMAEKQSNNIVTQNVSEEEKNENKIGENNQEAKNTSQSTPQLQVSETQNINNNENITSSLHEDVLKDLQAGAERAEFYKELFTKQEEQRKKEEAEREEILKQQQQQTQTPQEPTISKEPIQTPVEEPIPEPQEQIN